MDLRDKQRMFEKFKHFLNKNTEELPKGHLVNGNPEEGLRCFHFVRIKGDQKDKVIRCPQCAVPGSIFCGEHDYDRSLVDGKRSVPQIYKNKLHTLFERYLNEPTILDHKQDLAVLRTLLTGMVNKLTDPNKVSKENLVDALKNVIDSNDSISVKYESVMDIFSRHESVFSNQAIKNVNETVRNIGGCIDRINKAGSGDQFLMTPEGVNVMMRTIVEVLKKNVQDKDIMLQIQTDLMTISVATKGDLQKANDNLLKENG